MKIKENEQKSKIIVAKALIINISSLFMAVPKRKTSRSKRDMRRSHDSVKKLNVIIDKDSGEPRLSHKIDLSTGVYNGKQILIKKEKNKEDNSK